MHLFKHFVHFCTRNIKYFFCKKHGIWDTPLMHKSLRNVWKTLLFKASQLKKQGEACLQMKTSGNENILWSAALDRQKTQLCLPINCHCWQPYWFKPKNIWSIRFARDEWLTADDYHLCCQGTRAEIWKGGWGMFCQSCGKVRGVCRWKL